MNQKIKLLFIHHKLVCGGAEQALFDLLLLLNKQIFDITVFVESGGGEWESKFRNAGIRIETEEICLKKSRNPIVKVDNWVKRKRMMRAMREHGKGLLDICYPKEHFDVIIAYHSCWKQQKTFRKNSRTIKYIHGDVATLDSYRISIENIQDILPKFDYCICVSEIARQSFMELTGRIRNVCTILNPIDSERICKLADEPLELSEDVPIICAVGRLSPEKGFDRLIKIHRNLLDKGYAHRLVIIGDGELRHDLEVLVEQTSTQDSVLLAGYKSNPYPYIKHSSFLVCSSYSEGLGMVAMEALCLGIPVVSSASAVGELIGNELCGIITESDDVSLEAGIERVLSDKAFYQRLREGAQHRSTCFEGKRMVQDIEKLFISLAESEM